MMVFFCWGFAGTLAGSHLTALVDRVAALRLQLAERRHARQILAEQAPISLDPSDRDV